MSAAVWLPPLISIVFAIVVFLMFRYVLPGTVDGEYPTVATGDIYPIGSIRRRLYLLGKRWGQRTVERERRNRELSRERRERGL